MIYFFTLNGFLFFFNCFNYAGNLFILTFFFFSSNFYVVYSFRKQSIFTEKFLSIFLWFGFWFKFSFVNNGLSKLVEGAGSFDFSSMLYDKALLILSFAFCLLIFLSYLRQFFFSYNNFFNKFFLKKQNIVNLFFKYQIYIISLFILIFLSFSILNHYYFIYRKGIISNQNINQVFLLLFKWLTMFGFASISSFVIYCYIQKKKNLYIALLISIFESASTSLGSLSRATFVFTQLSFYFALNKYIELTKKKIVKYSAIVYLLLVFGLTPILNFFVTKERNFLFYIKTSEQNSISENIPFKKFNLSFSNNDIKNYFDYLIEKDYFFSESLYLFINRWVGLDSWLAVVSYPNLSLNIFTESLKEKFNKNEYSFYQKIFLNKNEHYEISKLDNNYGIILPGFFAYSFYSGSIYFFLFLITFFYSFGIFLEYLSFRLSFGNYFFSSLVSYVYVYRLIHFGYLPAQSYLILSSLIFNIMMYYFIILIVNKFIKN
jgi:hypothetical protein